MYERLLPPPHTHTRTPFLLIVYYSTQAFDADAFLARSLSEPELSLTHWLLDLAADISRNEEVNKMSCENMGTS